MYAAHSHDQPKAFISDLRICNIKPVASEKEKVPRLYVIEVASAPLFHIACSPCSLLGAFCGLLPSLLLAVVILLCSWDVFCHHPMFL